MEDHKQSILAKTPIFARLAPESPGMRYLTDAAREIECRENEILFREGDTGDSLYILVRGSVRILKDNVPVITLREPGMCFGEMALITEDPRSATAEINEPTLLFKIFRADFDRALEKDSSIARGVFSALNHKLRENLQDRLKSQRRELARRESLRMVADIQQSLLPQDGSRNTRIELAGLSRPADIVGGDYFDYLDLPDERLGLFVADVMDHGLHSAMLMAMLKSGLHTQIRFDASVSAVLQAVNRIADEQVGIFIYLTCCYVQFAPGKGELEYANAGSPPMLLYRPASGELLELESMYSPPGLLPPDYREPHLGKRVPWTSGDVLLIYTDGLTESENRDHEMFGEARVKAALRRASGGTAGEILALIRDDWEAFLAGHPPRDDTTLVVAKAL